MRITEELSEVSYLDQIGSSPSIIRRHRRSSRTTSSSRRRFPEFRLFGATQRTSTPGAATDDGGRDVRERLLASDQAYPDGFARNYGGVAELHTLDLDFGAVAPGNRAVLVLNGWVDWADGSTFIGAGAGTARPGLCSRSLQVRRTSADAGRP